MGSGAGGSEVLGSGLGSGELLGGGGGGSLLVVGSGSGVDVSMGVSEEVVGSSKMLVDGSSGIDEVGAALVVISSMGEVMEVVEMGAKSEVVGTKTLLSEVVIASEVLTAGLN